MEPVLPHPMVRAANLGGWLVTEGWIQPSLFDGIPNKDLLDGTQLQFKSVTQNAYVAAENGGGAAVVANRATASGWETFKLRRIDQDTFNFKVFSDQFVSVAGINVVATAATPGQFETFQLVPNNNDKNLMRIKAPNGSFLQANKDGSVTADFGASTNWGDEDPSVFAVTMVGIPNNDLLDGTQLQFKSITQKAYVAAENGGGAALAANRAVASGWETFKLWRIDQNTFIFKVFSDQFVSVAGINVVATASTPGQFEMFQLVRNDNDKNKMRIKAPNGSFLQAHKDGSVTADFDVSTKWGDDDPSVFAVTIVDIPNKDLLDRTQLQFKSVARKAYVSAQNGGGAALVANRATASGWETFKLRRIDQNTFNFKVFSDQFVSIADVNVVATAATPGQFETFQLVRKDNDKNRMRIKAPNGSFLQANKDGSVTANFGVSTNWGDDDPSVFAVTIVRTQPSLFDDIPNKDLLDGTQLQLKSVTQKAYVAAENGGGAVLVANRATASSWETFKLWRIDQNTFNFKVFSDQFVSVAGVNVVTTAGTPGQFETFQLVRNDNDKNVMRIKAPNGSFLQANKDGSVTADSGVNSTWGDDDPSVFEVTIVATMQGEYQVCNGYGKDKATQVMNNHWSTYIVESDFAFMAANGLNAVRIPVGWWIASGSKPPAPFVGGSLPALDNAFNWAEKHNIRVIIDLHTVPGSQNPYEHSGTRDGSQTWGDSNIAQTVQVIDFLAARYAGRSILLAVELMNEPRAPGVSLDSLKKYYEQAYNTVRKYSITAYVIMSTRLNVDSTTELVEFASRFDRVVLDVHFYNLFNNMFDSFTVQQNIDYVNNTIANGLKAMTRPDGPLTFVGEWVVEWKVNGATKADYQRFAKAQIAVYEQATFGWAYWTYKNVQNHWSMQGMIKDGYISLQDA